MQKTIEKGPGNHRKMTKNFIFSPMNDFKNVGFYIPKIYKTWRKKIGSNSDVDNKYSGRTLILNLFNMGYIRKRFRINVLPLYIQEGVYLRHFLNWHATKEITIIPSPLNYKIKMMMMKFRRIYKLKKKS